MGLTATQRVSLATQGLSHVTDFSEFGEDEIEQATKNMRTSIPPIPAVAEVLDNNNVVVVAAVPAVPPILPVILPAKSTHRLLVASIAYAYYTDTSRDVTAVNMHYTNVLKDFYIEWKAIVAMTKTTSTDVPAITRNNPPLKWTDSFNDYCLNTFGVRQTPLAYVIRKDVEVLPESRPAGDTTSKIDELIPGKAFGLGGSVLNDLVSRLSHDHPLYQTDNAKVYSALEEATRSTTYSATVKSFSRKRDGRGAWQALVRNYAGSDKWEALQTANTKWLLNEKWTGASYSLEKFCNQHRTRFVNLNEAKNHVDFQLPTEHTRVGYLIDNIINSDPDLRAALANIRQNVNETRSDFEGSVAVLLPVDPYKKSRKRGNDSTSVGANISSAAISPGTSSSNDGTGSTGVVLKFHDGASYSKLNSEQKAELYEWRKSPRGQKFSQSERKKRKASALKRGGSNNAIKSAVQSALAQERKKQKKNSDDVDKIAELIAGASVSNTSAVPATPVANSSSTSAITEAHKAAAIKMLKFKRDSDKSSN